MKKGVIKVLSLLLVMAFCFGSFSYVLAALSSKENVTTEVPLIQNGDFEQLQPKREYFKSSGIATFQASTSVSDYIYESLLDCKSSFNIYSYNVPLDDFSAIYCEVINSHPDLFYASSSVSYNYRYNYLKRQNYVYDINPIYAMEATEIENAKAVFENGVQKALSNVDSEMNDVQKCLVLHDYLCDIATYPQVFDSDGNASYDKDIYHSAYGVFYDGKCVCAGYTLAYSYLLSRVGVETKHVTSSPMSHAWNKVKISGKWYNVDLTFDDLSYQGNGYNTVGAIRHNCFLKSDSAITGDIGRYHFGGETYGDASATDASFDDYFWNEIDTSIPVINGDYYYLSPASTQYLMKRTKDGEESKVGSSPFNSTSVTFSGKATDENGIAHDYSFVDYLNRLVYFDNRFYINSSKAIYSYSNMNGTWKKSTIASNLSNYVVGLSTANNELTYQLYSDYEILSLNRFEILKNNLTLPNSKQYNNYADMNLDGKINAKDYAIIKATI